jgi:hypothetical protein
MMRKFAPGLMVCGLGIAGLGIAGPMGCAGNQPQAMDSRRFLPPVTTADSFDGGSESGPQPGAQLGAQPGTAIVASEDLKPATAAALTGEHLTGEHLTGEHLTGEHLTGEHLTGEQPKNATILPDPALPTTRPFPTIEPIGELGSTPTTEPTQAAPAQAGPAQPSSSQQGSSPAQPNEAAPSALETNAVENNAVGTTAAGTSAPAQPAPSDIQSKGVYLTLGGVLAQVNDTPIYANAVLAPLKKEFAAKARELSPDDFRDFAAHEIMQQLHERIDDESYFATAYHALSQDDKNLAEAHAMMDRHDWIIAAGGSIEQARKQSAERGEDFDQRVLKNYRELVFELYQRRAIAPLIQVNADDMRDFYRHNVDKLYSTKAEAQFRVIEVDKTASSVALDTTQPVQNDIAAIRERAVKGEDFAAMASTLNDDAYLRDRAGCPLGEGKWIERGSYILDALEAEVWKLQPGQITPVVEIGGKQYIAKLEARHEGSVRAFEDPVVQIDIYRQLRQIQFNQLWKERKDESATQAMISPPDPKRFEVALEMAMQKYAQVQQVAAGH